ncbi:hypothetical protein PVAND_013760 [Polypedilum vanderplanki]|uniref:Mediator of RNA polymerase II transcription subunit 28 n=1 Tax=Polypedilum vanderplanki TaxID=319348 RepID=A0A9J6CRL5_POLVA|nr:hypothetical protein PVAND_013760 [Polypedilum vanderplanki]
MESNFTNPPSNSLMDKFEQSFISCIHNLTMEEPANGSDKDEIKVEVENTIANFIDLARQMECFFLQKRFQLSVLKPELLLKEENIDLRHEIARKDELLKKHAGKIAKWKEILNDNSPAATIPPNSQMPPNPQMPQQNQPQQQMVPGGSIPPQIPQMHHPGSMQPGFGVSHAIQRPPFGHMNMPSANPLAFLEKTTNNIMEPRMSEENKDIALEKIKKWIENHSFIKKCCTEDFFLLSFLRVRNFSFEEAIKVIENYFLFRFEHKEWFDMSDKQIEKYREIVKSGFSYLTQDENKGGLIMVTNVAQANVEIFSIDDIYHCFFLNFTLAIFDETTQKSGLKLVSNLSDVSVKQIGIYPVGHVVNFGKHMANSSPVSFQQYSLIGVPSFAVQIVNVLKMALPENIRNQTKIMKDFSELPNVMDIRSLPEELGGGSVKQNEMIEKHLKNFDEKLTLLKEISKFELDLNEIEKILGTTLTNNFKHLNID